MSLVCGVVLAAQLGAASAFAQEGPPETPPPVAGTPPPTPPPPARTLPAPAPPRYRLPAADDVKVHLDSNFAGAGLEPAELGAPRCLAPCDRPFPRDGIYRITGDGLIPSEAFRLPARPDTITLDVDAGMTAQKSAGAVIAISGLVVGSLGALYSTLLAIESIEGPLPSGWQKDLSVGAAVGGLVATAVGALLYFTAGTRVRTEGAPLRSIP